MKQNRVRKTHQAARDVIKLSAKFLHRRRWIKTRGGMTQLRRYMRGRRKQMLRNAGASLRINPIIQKIEQIRYFTGDDARRRCARGGHGAHGLRQFGDLTPQAATLLRGLILRGGGRRNAATLSQTA
jgi:hypothetical protein